jgi:hypothetical protein
MQKKNLSTLNNPFFFLLASLPQLKSSLYISVFSLDKCVAIYMKGAREK